MYTNGKLAGFPSTVWPQYKADIVYIFAILQLNTVQSLQQTQSRTIISNTNTITNIPLPGIHESTLVIALLPRRVQQINK
jgi:hypothetical protein